MDETIRLLYCGNEEAYEAILFSAISAMRSTKRPLRITIFSALLDLPCGKPIDQARANYLRTLLENRRDGSGLSYLDLSKTLTDFLLRSGFHEEKYRPYSFLRLFADRCAETGKLLYLDPSTLFCADAGAVFDQDLHSAGLGAAPYERAGFWLQSGALHPGVLLMDLGKLREDGFFERTRNRLQRNRPYAPLYEAINGEREACCTLPEICNEQSRARSDTVIRYFPRHLRLLPYPRLEDADPIRSYEMKEREYRRFVRIYEEFLLQRDGRVAL